MRPFIVPILLRGGLRYRPHNRGPSLGGPYPSGSPLLELRLISPDNKVKFSDIQYLFLDFLVEYQFDPLFIASRDGIGLYECFVTENNPGRRQKSRGCYLEMERYGISKRQANNRIMLSCSPCFVTKALFALAVIDKNLYCMTPVVPSDCREGIEIIARVSPPHPVGKVFQDLLFPVHIINNRTDQAEHPKQGEQENLHPQFPLSHTFFCVRTIQSI